MDGKKDKERNVGKLLKWRMEGWKETDGKMGKKANIKKEICMD